MLSITSIYEDVIDTVKQEQNGTITFLEFNRKSRLAELRLLDYISGDISGQQPPEPYTTQKVYDFLTPFLKETTANISDGKLIVPSDYYLFEEMFIIGSYKDKDECGKDRVVSNENTPIELLDSSAFEMRKKTYISSLKPSIAKPIAKKVGKYFYFAPTDLGPITLVFKRYPVFGEIKTMVDPVYNDVVPNPATSVNYEWDEKARGMLIWFIAQRYGVSNRENALTEQLNNEGKEAKRP